MEIKEKHKEPLPKEEVLKIAEAREKDPIFLFKRLYPEIERKLIEEEKDLKERGQRFKEFIKAKSNENLLSQAQKRFEQLLKEGDLNFAFILAESYLDKKTIERAGNLLLAETYSKMKESKDKTEMIELAKKIISSNFLPEISRPSHIIEEAMVLLLELRDKRRKISELNFYANLFNFKTFEWLTLPIKNEEIFEVAHLLARRRVANYLKTNKSIAAELASVYEKKGFLNLDKDADIFEELTK